jgi:hypothetical protein
MIRSKAENLVSGVAHSSRYALVQIGMGKREDHRNGSSRDRPVAFPKNG